MVQIIMKGIIILHFFKKSTPVVRHHMNKYDGHFPIWVIIEYFSLGTLSYFYRGMKNNDKHLDFPYQWKSLLRHKKEAATLIS